MSATIGVAFKYVLCFVKCKLIKMKNGGTAHEINTEKYKKEQILIERINNCQIKNCKLFDDCNKKQVKGNKVKCINYKSRF